MKSSTVIIIQARMQSTRMPQKVLLPFYKKKGILQLQIERLLTQFEKHQLIVATSHSVADDAIDRLCKQLKIKCFRGSEENVLSRFITCAEENNIDKIVRVCADNVFIDVDRITQLFDMDGKIDIEYDYISYSVNGVPGIKTHYGIWSEWVSLKALKKVQKLTNESFYTEHVTNYIYSHPKIFNSYFFDVDLSDYPQIRLTTDTQEDFEMQKELFKKMVSKYGLQFTTTHIFEEINETPQYLSIMKQQIELNEK